MCYFSSSLPGFFLCSSEVPIEAYSSLNQAAATLILSRLNDLCNGTDPEVPPIIIFTDILYLYLYTQHIIFEHLKVGKVM